MTMDRLALDALIERCLRGDHGSDCFREGDAYRVRLWGNLPGGWTSHFALHAGALGLEIVAGEAICVSGERLKGEIWMGPRGAESGSTQDRERRRPQSY
jgi:hypothetical protein